MDKFVFDVILPSFLKEYKEIYSITDSMATSNSHLEYLSINEKNKEKETKKLFNLLQELLKTDTVFRPIYSEIIERNLLSEEKTKKLNSFISPHVLILHFIINIKTLYFIYINSTEKYIKDMALESIYASSGAIYSLSNDIINILNDIGCVL